MIESIGLWRMETTVSLSPTWLPKVWIAHRNHEVRAQLRRSLDRVGYHIIDRDDSDQLHQLVSSSVPQSAGATSVDLVICEAELLRGRPLEVIVQRQTDETFPPLIVVLTDEGGRSELSTALRTVAVFDEPFATPAQLASIRKLLPLQRHCSD